MPGRGVISISNVRKVIWLNFANLVVVIQLTRLCPIYGFSAPPHPPLQNCLKLVFRLQRCLKLVIDRYSVPAGASEKV